MVTGMVLGKMHLSEGGKEYIVSQSFGLYNSLKEKCFSGLGFQGTEFGKHCFKHLLTSEANQSDFSED